MAEISCPAPTNAFRLLRVISIDSYAPGGEVILTVSGGAILTGENGAGKTSLIRLIPVFFGELPRRISVGTQSFGDFYLARTTSYIIFEYERRGVVCQAVIYAGSTDTNAEAYAYRFIRAPYSLGLFTEDDGKTIIPGDGLSTHLKTLGISHSRALAHDAYRAIIQGRIHSGRDAAMNRAYVADYAFTPSNNRISHIDRIVSGMFRRQAEFRDFLRMVVSYISEKDEKKDETISISGDRSKIAAWPRQFAAYQQVMQHEDRMEEIHRLDAGLTSIDAQAGVVHAKLLVLGEHASSQVAKLEEERKAARDCLNDETQARAGEDEQLARKEADERATAEAGEAKVKSLDDKKEAYNTDRIEDLAALVDSLPALTTALRQAEGRRETLLGAKGDIDRQYDRFKQEEGRRLNERTHEALQEKDGIGTAYDKKLGALADRYEQETRDLASKHQTEIGNATEALMTARESVAVAQHAVLNPAPDKDLHHVWRLKHAAFEEAQLATEAPTKRRDAARRAVAAARKGFDRQDVVVQTLNLRIDGLGTRIEDLKAKAAPSADSLLAFLRQERPDWSLDIAKVINEDLLSRTDLEPAVVDGIGKALYGVSLDLSRIDSPLVADDARLQREVATLEAQRRDLRKDQEREATALQQARLALSWAEEEEASSEQAIILADAALGTARTEERASRSAMDRSQRENKAKAQAALDRAHSKEADARRQMAAAQGALQSAKDALKTKIDAERREIASGKRTVNSSIDKRIADDKRDTDARVRKLDEERNQALAAGGVDVKALGELEGEINELRRKVSEGTQSTNAVAEWRLWLTGEWAGRAHLVSEAVVHRGREGKIKQQRDTKAKAWEAHRIAESNRITQMGRDAAAAAEVAESARQLIARRDLDRFPPDAETRARAYDMAWTQDSLTAQITQLLRDRGVTLQDLKTRINLIKRSFREGTDTPTEDFYRITADAVDPDDDKPRAWVDPFRSWYAQGHTNVLRPLLIEARKFGELIIGFQREVDNFRKRIQTFNRSMQDALDQTIVFSRITRVQIRFSSTIEDKAYWGPINDFIRNHESWIHGISNDLPPTGFATDLDRLLEHWDIREGIRAERLGLIDVSGEVVENGVEKRFRDSASLAELSSNGLSYLILIVIFVAFLRMIRGDADIRVTYAVDELGDLDRKNIGILVGMLRQNGIDLVSACPDADLSVLMQFQNRYQVTRDSAGPELVEVDLEAWEAANV